MADQPGVVSPPPMAPGMADYQRLLQGGFSQQEADAWKADQTARLQSGGFSPQEISDHWGDGGPKMPSGLQDHMEANLARTDPNMAPHVANSPMDMIAAGWDQSVTGLAINQRPPAKVLPQDAGIIGNVLYAGAGAVGDLPATVAGIFGGAAAGAAVPGVGETGLSELAGAGAGAAALPQAMREIMVDSYNRGEVHSWQDFASMAGQSLWNTGKAALAGAAGGAIAGPAGAVVSRAAAPIAGTAAANILGTGANLTAQATTTAAVGGALDGRVPNAQDFTTSAALALAFHSTTVVAGRFIGRGTAGQTFDPAEATQRVASNLQEVYRQTGVTPTAAVDLARGNPKILDELIGQDTSGEPTTPNLKAAAPNEPEPYHTPASTDFVAGVQKLLPTVERLETGGLKDQDNAMSPAGAIGRYQIMPGTARQYGFDPAAMRDPVQAKAAATAILSDLYRRYNGDEAAVLVAYNAGPGRANSWIKGGRQLSDLPFETQRYLEKAGALPSQGQTETPVAPEPAKLAVDMTEKELVQNIHQMIGEEPNTNKELDPSTMYRQWVSELGPARAMDNALLDGNYDRVRDIGAEDMFRQTYASTARTGYFVREGTIIPAGVQGFKQTSEDSFMRALDVARKAGGDHAGFEAYLTSARALEKAKQGIDTGFDPELATRMVETTKGKYADAADIFYRANHGAIEYGRQSGLFTQDQADAITGKNASYVSFRRIMGDDAGMPAPGSGRGFKTRNPVAMMEGSDRQIIHPLIASVDNTHSIVKMADRNRAIGFVLDRQAGTDELGLRRVETPDAIATPDAGSVAPYGEDPGGYGSLLAERAARGGLKPNQFLYFRDGVPEVWEAKDEDLAQLMRGAGSPGEANIVSKVFQSVASAQRSGLTLTPDFAGRVGLRHQITAFILDPTHPPPFVTMMRGVMDVINHTETYDEWVRNGGAGSALAEMDRIYLDKDMQKVFGDTDTWSRMWNVARTPLDIAQMVSEKLDAMARVGYYKRAVGLGIDPLKAATLSRTAYLDYAEKGTLPMAQAWARWVPFMRPHILGMKQASEAFASDPWKTAGAGLLTTMMPAIGLYALNYFQDKSLPEAEKFANLPRWQKDMAFITPRIGGTRFKLPLPPVVGFVMGGFVNRFLDYSVQKDPRAFEGAVWPFLNDLIPPMTPTMIQPPLEAVTNHNFLSGHPLISGALDNNSTPMQYTATTTEPAKALSRALSPLAANTPFQSLTSPIAIENFVKGWAGTLGQDVLKALNAPFSTSGAPWQVADIPIAQSFVVRNPEMNAQPIQDFYTEAREFDTAHADLRLAMKRLQVGAGSLGEVQNYATVQAAARIDDVKKAIGMQEAAIQATNNNKQMTMGEKAQAVERMYSDMITTAKAGLDAMRSIR